MPSWFRGRALLLVCALWPLLSWSAPAPDASERNALVRTLKEILAQEPLGASLVGMKVVDLKTGAVLFHHDADLLLNPASNNKLFTAAASLSLLGPDYRYETDFLTDRKMKDGKVRTLYVRGEGDPTLNTEQLYQIVSVLHHLGLRRVGRIVVDDSYFDGQRNPPGYEQEDSDRAYMAPTGAVAFNLDTVGVYVRPTTPGHAAAVELEPPSKFFVVENHARTRRHGYTRISIHSVADGRRQRIIVRGSIPMSRDFFAKWKKIDNPPIYFGMSLRHMLIARGIRVTGGVRVGHAPKSAEPLYIHQSVTFDRVLKQMDKLSSNFTAEQIIKTLGAVFRGTPGSTENGVDVVEAFLADKVGIPRGTYIMKNGSGLNDADRWTASQVIRLLQYMYKDFPLAPEYLSSISIAGEDGTLRYRFEDSAAVGKLRAKTGTLSNVCALSGYATTPSGQRLAFSILVNDYPGHAGVVDDSLDALGTAVAMAGKPGAGKTVVAALDSAHAPDSLQTATARSRTYLALAAEGDRRNLDFLRTAWRTERDPAVRVVLADAIYRSNPEDYFGERALLDSLQTTPEVLGRLRKIATSLGVEVPGIGSVVELAANGDAEALKKLLALGQAAEGDADAEARLAGDLEQVARTVPEPLLLALKDAPAPRVAAAVSLLARKLALHGERHHPIWASVKKLSKGDDVKTAKFAKAFGKALTQAVSAARTAKAPEPRGAAQPVPASAAMPKGSQPGG